jgi:hypothetical protein
MASWSVAAGPERVELQRTWQEAPARLVEEQVGVLQLRNGHLPLLLTLKSTAEKK